MSVSKPKDTSTSVDPKDGFYHIPAGRYFSDAVSPVGFCPSPFLFANVLRPFLTYQMEFGVRLPSVCGGLIP